MNMRIGATLALGLGLLLSGCGGGGGDGGDAKTGPALVALTQANYDGITQEVTASVASSDALFSALDVASPASADTASVVQLASGQPDALARFALAEVNRSFTGRVKAAAVETGTELCDVGGSISATVNDVDNSGSATVGDRIAITATNCVFDSGEPALNGALSIRILSVAELDGYGDLVSGSLALSFTDFSSGDVGLNGSAVLTISPSALTLDFNGLAARYDGQTLVYDFAVTTDVAASTVSVVGPITVNGSTYVLATPTLLQLGTGHPVAGTLRITDGHGSRVDVVMGSTSYTASLYLAGDNLLDDSATHSW